MERDQTERRGNVLGELARVFEDHWDLLLLELGFESRQAVRRLSAIVVGVLFLFLSAIVAQVAVIYGLMALGLSAPVACLAVAGLYFLIALAVVSAWGRRDPRVGPPFHATRREVGRSLKWIQKLFS